MTSPRLILDVVKPEELLISPEEAPGHVLDLATSDDPRCWDRPLDRYTCVLFPCVSCAFVVCCHVERLELTLFPCVVVVVVFFQLEALSCMLVANLLLRVLYL